MPHETPQERYERKKAQKEASRAHASRKQRTGSAAKKVVIWLVALAVLAGGVWLLVASSSPEGEDFSRDVPVLGREHVTSSNHPPYNSNPPSSGWHYARTADLGFHEERLDDEFMVHNLEHGEIWVAYRPGVSEAVKVSLRELAGDKSNVVVTPREENEADIALVAWGRIDAFDIEEGGALPRQRIDDFIIRYQNRGPENPGYNPRSR